MVYGWCRDGVWLVYGWCMGGVGMVYGWCRDGVWVAMGGVAMLQRRHHHPNMTVPVTALA